MRTRSGSSFRVQVCDHIKAVDVAFAAAAPARDTSVALPRDAIVAPPHDLVVVLPAGANPMERSVSN